MRNYETGLDYANTDPSLHYNRIERSGPDWRNEYLRLLIAKDHDGAHLIRLQNDPDYKLDCEEQARASRVQKPLRSCRDMQIEQEVAEEDQEAAA